MKKILTTLMALSLVTPAFAHDREYGPYRGREYYEVYGRGEQRMNGYERMHHRHRRDNTALYALGGLLLGAIVIGSISSKEEKHSVSP